MGGGRAAFFLTGKPSVSSSSSSPNTIGLPGFPFPLALEGALPFAADLEAGGLALAWAIRRSRLDIPPPSLLAGAVDDDAGAEALEDGLAPKEKEIFLSDIPVAQSLAGDWDEGEGGRVV